MSPAQMTAFASVPTGGIVVLRNVQAGRSPWHGWDDGRAAMTPEGREAYEARARVITACRTRGLLTPEGVLSPEGVAAVEAWEARRA